MSSGFTACRSWTMYLVISESKSKIKQIRYYAELYRLEGRK